MNKAHVRLSLVMMVRDEIDVLPAFIAHHSALFDRLVVVDHLSDDGTREYLERIEGRVGPCEIEVLRYDEPGYHQSAISTMLARREFRRGAHWVTALDADEFLDVDGRGALLELLREATPVAVFSWVNLMPRVPPTGTEAIPLFETDQDFITLSNDWPPRRGKVMLHREFADRHRRFVLPDGNHRVLTGPRGPKARMRTAGRLLHVPARSPLQVVSKRRNLIDGRTSVDPRWVEKDSHEHQHQLAESLIGEATPEAVQDLMTAVVMHYEGSSGIGEHGESVAVVEFPRVSIPEALRPSMSRDRSLSAVARRPGPSSPGVDRSGLWVASVRGSTVTVRRRSRPALVRKAARLMRAVGRAAARLRSSSSSFRR